jgi:hypothetical protein
MKSPKDHVKVDILEKKIAKIYHGDRNIACSLGYADHLLAGRHQFEYLWEKKKLRAMVRTAAPVINRPPMI